MLRTFLCLFTATFSVYAAVGSFSAAGVLYCGGSRIDVGSYAAPLAVDWDGDGNKDLICGQFDGGYIRYYPNTGTNESPVFNNFFYLLDGANPISVPYG
ncbi:MAG: hypothetical protein KAQ97_01240 [Candidatus Fermentibacteraceae bacterium]|nr:hypothetical protein [Candidatus Fermentibacteraceae bacterium]